MRRFVQAAFVSAGLLLATFGCRSAPPIVLPADNEISRIEAWKDNTLDPKTMRDAVRTELATPDKITAVMNFLRAKNRAMRFPRDTFPSPVYTIVIHDTHGDNVVFFVGTDWLGGRNSSKDDAGRSRLTTLTGAEKGLLLQLLGLPE